jgi:hypothetical protein
VRERWPRSRWPSSWDVTAKTHPTPTHPHPVLGGVRGGGFFLSTVRESELVLRLQRRTRDSPNWLILMTPMLDRLDTWFRVFTDYR